MRYLINLVVFTLALNFAPIAHAAYTNYNSVMIGERAGGMGGAFTANTGDSAAGAYYNPATLARLEGSSLSTAVSLFNKYDVAYGSQDALGDSLFRINKGSILSIPSASGIFSSFRSFTAGLSVVVPDYQVFGGDVHKSGEDTTFLRYDDQSLWVGGAFAFNISEESALGLTVYYTSQTFSRSLTNRYDTGTEIVVLNEEKTSTQNSFVYLLGYYTELSDRWRMGLAYRFRSIAVDGKGSYLRSQVGTVSGAQPLVQYNNLESETRIPERLALGFSYKKGDAYTLSLDFTYHGPNRYHDFDAESDYIVQKDTFNVAFGFENYLEPWLALRMGVFTDYASTPRIPSAPVRRFQDNVDKYGFSANLGIHTTAHTQISIGGYYVGGDGYAAEQIGAGFERIRKSDRVFSFLVGSSYGF